MKIADIRATTETVALEVPLQHASGPHWGRFVDIIDGGMFEYTRRAGRSSDAGAR